MSSLSKYYFNLLFLLPIFFLLLPFWADAHTRWFAEGEIPRVTTNEPTEIYLILCFSTVAVIIFVGLFLEKKKKFLLSQIGEISSHSFNRAAATFTMIAGSFFVIAGTHEYLFSPNLTVEMGVPISLIVGQLLIGLMFLLGIYARIASVLLAFLWCAAIPFVGLEPLIEDIWVLSIIFFIMIMGNDYFSLISVKSLKEITYRYRSYALPILRIGTGITLIVLGFTEKILRPELGLNFLAQHDWNFLASFGVSDYLFVLMAGATESMLGLLLLLGILTRLTAFITAIIFSIPLFILGPIELTGHLPHFAAIIMLIIFGAGHHFRVFDRMVNKNSSK